MSDENSPDAEKPGIKISVEGNARGNIIIVGDENAVHRSINRANLPPNLTIVAVTAFVALFVFLLIAWGIFSFINKGSTETPVIIPTAAPSQPGLQSGIWKIELYGNLNLDGSPVRVFTLPAEANHEGGYQVSLTPQDLAQRISGMPADNYSLRLAGAFEFQAGYFEFHCEHHDGCRVYVDGYSWIDVWWDGNGGSDMARDLPAGKHIVVIEFYDKSGYGLLEVRWRIKP
jgi:hypothetical protein